MQAKEKCSWQSTEGGQGLVRVKATIQDETTRIQGYIRRMASSNELLSECLRQQQPKEEKKRRNYRGRTILCSACTTNRLKKWLMSIRPNWKRLHTVFYVHKLV